MNILLVHVTLIQITYMRMSSNIIISIMIYSSQQWVMENFKQYVQMFLGHSIL